MVIEQSSELINLSNENDRVGLVSRDGYLTILYRSIEVSDLRETLLMPKREYSVMESGIDSMVLAPTTLLSDVLNDSVFFYWHNPGSPGPRKFVVYDRYARELYSVPEKVQSKNGHWILMDISRFRKESAVLFGVRGAKKPRPTQLHRIFFDEKYREKIDTQLAPFKDDEDRLFYEFAIYSLNQLYHDRTVPFYKILSQQKVARDPFLKAYFKRVIEETPLGLVKISSE